MRVARYLNLRRDLLNGHWARDTVTELERLALVRPRSPEAALYFRALLWSGDYENIAAVRLTHLLSTESVVPAWCSKWLIPLLIRMGDTEGAARLYTGLSSLTQRQFRNNPAVLQLCYQHKLRLHKPAYSCEYLDELFDLTVGFKDFVTQHKGKSICIVGNAPAQENQPAERGLHIDSHDIVLRFNSFSINEAISGKKISLWVATPSRQKYHHADLNRDTPVMLTGNDLLYRPGRIAERLKTAVSEKRRIVLIDSADWRALSGRLESPPSAGLLLAYATVKHHQGPVSFFGFSGGDSVRNHSYDKSGFSTRHNWPQEHALYRELMPQRIS